MTPIERVRAAIARSGITLETLVYVENSASLLKKVALDVPTRGAFTEGDAAAAEQFIDAVADISIPSELIPVIEFAVKVEKLDADAKSGRLDRDEVGREARRLVPEMLALRSAS